MNVFILEGLGTFDKVLKGKFLKFVNMKNKILDGKKVNNLNVIDFNDNEIAEENR